MYTVKTKRAEDMTIGGLPTAKHTGILADYMANSIQGFASWALAASEVTEIRQGDMARMLKVWFEDFVDIESE